MPELLVEALIDFARSGALAPRLLIACCAASCAPDPREDQLAAAWREAKVSSAAALALAQNEAAYEADLRKYDRIFEGTGVYRRVPLAFDAASFQRALAAHAARHGLRVADFTAAARPIDRRALPETVPADQKFELTEDDVRGVVEVQFSLAPLDLVRAERWFHDLAALGPFLKVAAIRPERRGARVAGETFHFLPPRWPRYVRRAPDLRALLRAAGVEDDPETLVRGRHAARLAEIRAELDAEAAALLAINRALAVLSESQFRAARYSFFTRTAGELEGLAFSDVLK